MERRLAAILFTDVVGYTALMGRDEAAGRRVRARHESLVRAQVAGYHGRWIEERGDESLSIFPSALDAVNCAVAIQAELADDPELALRIGIHLGDVTVEDDRVFGDGVNVASRIRALAEPGGVCVSGPVCDSIKNQPNLDGTALGERELKGVAAPVAVYSVTGSVVPPAPQPRTERRTASRLTAPIAAAAIGVVALLVLAFWWGARTPAVAAPIRSIAVLPLENLSADPEQEFFAAGMTDALIGNLARLGSLRVISRRSVMRHKDSEQPLPELARELEADVVVEGSVLRADGRVRITAQLIDARSDRHLWSGSYEHDLRDVLKLQAEVAQAVAKEIAHELTPREQEHFDVERSVDPEAYSNTLKGLQLVRSVTPADHGRSIVYFQRAIDADPDYAPAYAGLAWAYM